MFAWDLSFLTSAALSHDRMKNPSFKEVLTRIEAHPDCRNLPMISFLILPMQRVTRLPLLMDVSASCPLSSLTSGRPTCHHQLLLPLYHTSVFSQCTILSPLHHKPTPFASLLFLYQYSIHTVSPMLLLHALLQAVCLLLTSDCQQIFSLCSIRAHSSTVQTLSLL